MAFASTGTREAERCKRRQLVCVRVVDGARTYVRT